MSTTPEKVRDRFAKDIASHKLTIALDNGIYRHLVCARPGTRNMSFEVVTWPGYLAIVGDMHDFVFWRTNDMFDFFRSDDGSISPGYWAEKVQAKAVHGGTEGFSVDKFRANVIDHAKGYLDDGAELPPDLLEELEPLLSAEDEYECVAAIRQFDSDRIDFADFWESSCTEWSFHYLWCCHAIVWAIGEYDMTKRSGGMEATES